jgi:hypothetical protein
MSDNPFQSVRSPVSFSFSQPQVLGIVFILVFFVWAIYTIIIIYHWIRFGHRSTVGIPIIIAHLLISAGLFLMAFSGFA